MSRYEVCGNEDLRKFSQFVPSTAPRTSAGDTPHFMQVGHGIHLRGALFETEAAIEIRTYPQMPPTTDVRNVVCVEPQVFAVRNGY